MGAYPFDPHDRLLKINGYHEAVRIALDVEDNSLGGQHTGTCISPLHLSSAFPFGMPYFLKPGIKSILNSAPVRMPLKRFDESQECSAGYDPHLLILACAHFGLMRVYSRCGFI